MRKLVLFATLLPFSYVYADDSINMAGQAAAEASGAQDSPQLIEEAIKGCKNDHESQILELSKLTKFDHIMRGIMSYLGVSKNNHESILARIKNSSHVTNFLILTRDASSSIHDMEKIMLAEKKQAKRSEYARNCGLLNKNISYQHNMVLLPAVKEDLPTWIKEVGGLRDCNCPKKFVSHETDRLRKGESITLGPVILIPTKGNKDIPKIKLNEEWKPTFQGLGYDKKTDRFTCNYTYEIKSLGLITNTKSLELVFSNMPAEFSPVQSIR